MDLKHRTWPEAMELAKMQSGKTNDQIAREISVLLGRETPFPASTIQGWFNLDREYWPSTSILPHLCRVLGNTILVQWLSAQVQGDSGCAPAPTPGNILSCLPSLVSDFGRVGQSVSIAIEDGGINPKEAREILDEVSRLEGRLKDLGAILAPLAEKAKRRA
jgi:hypothetical protein